MMQSSSKKPLGTMSDSKDGRRQIEKRIKSQLNSKQCSHQTSMVNLSDYPRTEIAAFQPNHNVNPLKLLRVMQAKQNYVWYAVYDEDMIHTTLMKKIGLCEDKCLPHEFLPWRLHHMQAYLHCEN